MSNIKEKQVMHNLNDTFYDAKIMYDFLAEKLCFNLQDITIMSEKRDFFRVWQKP